MSQVKVQGNPSGTGIFTIASPNSNNNQTLTLPNSTGTIALQTAPQVTVYTSGSGTYTVPTGCSYLIVEMCGGGGGSGGAGNAAGPSYGGAGTSGGNSTFGSSLLIAAGGAPGTPAGGASSGGVGGAATVNSPAVAIVAVSGGDGLGPTIYYGGNGPPNQGGANPFGGNGTYSGAPKANTGAGGYGAFATNTGSGAYNGTGGGAGGYIKALITNPSASYSYAVGAAGSAGSAGSGQFAGTAGASGVVIVTAYF